MAGLEFFANNVTSALSGDITSGQTSITVASSSGVPIPSYGVFRFIVDNEIMACTSRSGNTWTVQRAQEGTSAAAHTSGSTIYLIVTKGSLEALRSDKSVIRADARLITSASQPGRLFLAQDSNVLRYDDGGQWNSLNAAANLIPFDPPSASAFTWFNQGSATLFDHGDAFTIQGYPSSGDHLRIVEKTIPTAPYMVTACVRYTAHAVNYVRGGMCLRDSAGGRVRTFGWIYGTRIQLMHYNNADSYNGTSSEIDVSSGANNLMWFRIYDDNTNRIYYWSHNGVTWVPYYSESRSNWLTPDKIGFYVDSVTTAAYVYPALTVYSYEEVAQSAAFNPVWYPNGRNSSWVSRGTTNGQGAAPWTFTRTFDLTGYTLSTTYISAKSWVDNAATVALNGNTIGTGNTQSQPFRCDVAQASPYFNQGTNTLTITLSTADQTFDAVRFDGFVTGDAGTISLNTGLDANGAVMLAGGNDANWIVTQSGGGTAAAVVLVGPTI